MRLGIVRQLDNECAVSASFAVILDNKSLTLAASACAYSVQFCVLSFFFSGDDNARTRTRLWDTVTERQTVLPAAASTVVLTSRRRCAFDQSIDVGATRSAPRGGEL